MTRLEIPIWHLNGEKWRRMPEPSLQTVILKGCQTLTRSYIASNQSITWRCFTTSRLAAKFLYGQNYFKVSFNAHNGQTAKEFDSGSKSDQRRFSMGPKMLFHWQVSTVVLLLVTDEVPFDWWQLEWQFAEKELEVNFYSAKKYCGKNSWVLITTSQNKNPWRFISPWWKRVIRSHICCFAWIDCNCVT